MNIKSFLWDKLLEIVFNITGILVTAGFIGIMSGFEAAVLLAGIWAGVFILYCIVSYLILKKRIADIKKTVAEAKDEFLLSELIPPPLRSEDRLYYEIMLVQGKAAIDRVSSAEKEKADYYDYISQWVHEIKTPIAAIGLICANNKGEAFNGIAGQLGRINNYGEQILYEVKANNAEKDLMIRETELSKVVNECIKDNKQLFIDSGITINVAADGIVLSDGKWIGFILKQLLYNSVQYSRSENAEINILATAIPGCKTELSVWDNGIGILESELPRIFDKGYSGSNGRRNKKSTGLGLYLCKKLCKALDIDIRAESACGEYTRFSLVFNSNLTKL